MRTVYQINDTDIENAAERMADDYEVSREVMTMALEEYVVYRLEAFMDELSMNASHDDYFDRCVDNAKRKWKRANLYGDQE